MTGAWPWLALATLLAAGAMAGLLRQAARLPHDHPNARSLHDRPVPRVGGLAIWAGYVPVAALVPPAVPGPGWAWWCAGAAILAVSLFDDVRGARAVVRLAVHLLAAAAVALAISGGALLPALALALALGWGANLYNFMDGSDGLAAMMSVTGFGAYAVASAAAGGGWVGYAALAVATVPFLVANWPPARVFLGDAGSVLLGFLAAAFGGAGVATGAWPWWFPLLVFLPFWLDATVTLLRRLLRGARVWQAHREHYYQRLNALGAGHRGTLVVYGSAMVTTAVAACACLRWAPAWGPALLGAMVAASAAGFAAVDYHWRGRVNSR